MVIKSQGMFMDDDAIYQVRESMSSALTAYGVLAKKARGGSLARIAAKMPPG